MLVVLGVGVTAGMSYTNTPQFCGSCHVMEGVVESHAANKVHSDLDCNDCHLPHDNIFSKLVYKGKAGMTHFYHNTFNSDNIPDPIKATDSTIDVVQKNCASCHEEFLASGKHKGKDNKECLKCHLDDTHAKK